MIPTTNLVDVPLGPQIQLNPGESIVAYGMLYTVTKDNHIETGVANTDLQRTLNRMRALANYNKPASCMSCGGPLVGNRCTGRCS